jgi:hypothetical protein
MRCVNVKTKRSVTLTCGARNDEWVKRKGTTSCVHAAYVSKLTLRRFQLLPCDYCEGTFHMCCVKPALTQMPTSWLCSTCKLTSMELFTSKLAIGWRELRTECNRLLRVECEKAAEIHRKSMLCCYCVCWCLIARMCVRHKPN